jgi:dipeptidyl aminopeptidase/acylaminoacyl peptidase
MQFLANQSIGVLQVNFRDSTGYGKAFWEAGFKQGGRRMQNDIIDGARWLIDRGIADPKQIGICRASYEGHAVLTEPAFTPDLYACGVEYMVKNNKGHGYANKENMFEFYRSMEIFLGKHLGENATIQFFLHKMHKNNDNVLVKGLEKYSIRRGVPLFL